MACLIEAVNQFETLVVPRHTWFYQTSGGAKTAPSEVRINPNRRNAGHVKMFYDADQTQ
jgi:hypothetical protein